MKQKETDEKQRHKTLESSEPGRPSASIPPAEAALIARAAVCAAICRMGRAALRPPCQEQLNAGRAKGPAAQLALSQTNELQQSCN